MKVSANIVIPDHDHGERVLRIIEQHGRDVIVRMLAEAGLCRPEQFSSLTSTLKEWGPVAWK